MSIQQADAYTWIDTQPHEERIEEEEEVDPRSYWTYAKQLRGPAFLVVIAGVAIKVFKYSFLPCFFAAAVTNFGTRIAKKICDGYTFMATLQEGAFSLIKKYPYIFVVGTIVCFIFCTYAPLLSMMCAATNGILAGLTIEVYSHYSHIATA